MRHAAELGRFLAQPLLLLLGQLGAFPLAPRIPERMLGASLGLFELLADQHRLGLQRHRAARRLPLERRQLLMRRQCARRVAAQLAGAVDRQRQLAAQAHRQRVWRLQGHQVLQRGQRRQRILRASGVVAPELQQRALRPRLQHHARVAMPLREALVFIGDCQRRVDRAGAQLQFDQVGQGYDDEKGVAFLPYQRRGADRVGLRLCEGLGGGRAVLVPQGLRMSLQPEVGQVVEAREHQLALASDLLLGDLQRLLRVLAGLLDLVDGREGHREPVQRPGLA